MYKVLIADDEIYVATLIEKLVDWPSFGMEIISVVHDGETAFSQIQLLQPDVVLVDIRMPGYDGLTLIQKTRDAGFSTRFVIISGHKRFDYAKQAIQHDVDDYLLKPINRGELENVLRRVKERLVQEEKQQKQQDVHQQMDMAAHVFRDHLFDRLLSDQKMELPLSVDACNAQYQTNFVPGALMVFALQCDGEERQMDAKRIAQQLEERRNQVSDEMQALCYEFLTVIRGRRLWGICNFEAEAESHMRQIVMRMSSKRSAGSDSLRFTCARSPVVTAMDELGRALSLVEKLLDRRVALGVGQTLEAADMHHDEGILPLIVNDRKRAEFLSCLYAMNLVELRTQIQAFFQLGANYVQRECAIYSQLGQRLLSLFYQSLAPMGLFQEGLSELERRWNEEMLLCRRADQMADVLYGLMEKIWREVDEEPSGTSSPPVRIAKKYIALHYKEEITLHAIAKVVHLNPAYFSMLFKRETGVNFIDYLNQHRITVACSLLLDVTQNIAQVAEKSGFKDARYFSKLFKKQVGMTPTEYRLRNV